MCNLALFLLFRRIVRVLHLVLETRDLITDAKLEELPVNENTPGYFETLLLRPGQKIS